MAPKSKMQKIETLQQFCGLNGNYFREHLNRDDRLDFKIKFKYHRFVMAIFFWVLSQEYGGKDLSLKNDFLSVETNPYSKLYTITFAKAEFQNIVINFG